MKIVFDNIITVSAIILCLILYANDFKFTVFKQSEKEVEDTVNEQKPLYIIKPEPTKRTQ